jgi:hypothetical protein
MPVPCAFLPVISIAVVTLLSIIKCPEAITPFPETQMNLAIPNDVVFLHKHRSTEAPKHHASSRLKSVENPFA